MKLQDFSRRWTMRAIVVAVLLVLLFALLALVSKVRGSSGQNSGNTAEPEIIGVKYPSAFVVGNSVKSVAEQAKVKKTATSTTASSYKKPGQNNASSSSSTDKKDSNDSDSESSDNKPDSQKTNDSPVIASVLVDGEYYNYEGNPVTVEQLLAFFGIELGENDWIDPSMDTVLEDGLIIAVNRVSYDEVSEIADGYNNTYLVTYVDGEPVDWELISSEVAPQENSSDSTGEDTSSQGGGAGSEQGTTSDSEKTEEKKDSSESNSDAETKSDSEAKSDSGTDSTQEQTQEQTQTSEEESSDSTAVNGPSSSGHLTAASGIYYFGDQLETYYNMDMTHIVNWAQQNGIPGSYWIRDDGCKMYGDYIIVACNRDVYPYGTTVETSLGTGISLDTGGFAASNPTQVDIATNW